MRTEKGRDINADQTLLVKDLKFSYQVKCLTVQHCSSNILSLHQAKNVVNFFKNITRHTVVFRFFSCSALSDLIKNAPAEDFIDDLPKIWDTTFKVIDDIKVSAFFHIQVVHIKRTM